MDQERANLQISSWVSSRPEEEQGEFEKSGKETRYNEPLPDLHDGTQDEVRSMWGAEQLLQEERGSVSEKAFTEES